MAEQINLFGNIEEATKTISDNCIPGSKVFTCIGASNHTVNVREKDDFYATHPIAAKILIQAEQFKHNIWEPACGQGHLAKEFELAGYKVLSTDLIDRGYGIGGVDFFSVTSKDIDCSDMDIVTNPPYTKALEFAEHALDLLPQGGKVALFLKLTFLEGKQRRQFFDKNPFYRLYVSSSRIQCAKNGDFGKYGESAVAYGWYVWQKGFIGDPVIKWIN